MKHEIVAYGYHIKKKIDYASGFVAFVVNTRKSHCIKKWNYCHFTQHFAFSVDRKTDAVVFSFCTK